MPRWSAAFRMALPPAAIALAVTPLWTAYLALAFVPQLVFWVAYTIVLGMLAGTIVAAFGRRSSS